MYAVNSAQQRVHNIVTGVQAAGDVATEAGQLDRIARDAAKLRGELIDIDPTIEAPGTYNFFTKYTTNTEAVLTAVIGGTAGSILTISGPKVQMTGVKHERRGHTAIYRCGLAFNRSSGNDCLTLTTT
jgi:hypothetical protein